MKATEKTAAGGGSTAVDPRRHPSANRMLTADDHSDDRATARSITTGPPASPSTWSPRCANRRPGDQPAPPGVAAPPPTREKSGDCTHRGGGSGRPGHRGWRASGTNDTAHTCELAAGRTRRARRHCCRHARTTASRRKTACRRTSPRSLTQPVLPGDALRHPGRTAVPIRNREHWSGSRSIQDRCRQGREKDIRRGVLGNGPDDLILLLRHGHAQPAVAVARRRRIRQQWSGTCRDRLHEMIDAYAAGDVSVAALAIHRELLPVFTPGCSGPR